LVVAGRPERATLRGMASSSRFFIALAFPAALVACGGEVTERVVRADAGRESGADGAVTSPSRPSQPQPSPTQPEPQPTPLPEPVLDASMIPTPPDPCPIGGPVGPGIACSAPGITCPSTEGECPASCTCGTATWNCTEPVCGMPPPSEKCAVGNPCAIEDLGTTCTLRGGGPCGVDAVLVCEVSESADESEWKVKSFPCQGGVESCGFGSGDCTEQCMCESGEMVCTGDCPDGGISDP
jgi:hypothetical protein